MWDEEKLGRITELIRSAGSRRWPEICVKLNIRKGFPLNVIAGAKYGSKATADEYLFRTTPRYDDTRNMVIVENPWHIWESLPVVGKYIEFDAELAIKILVLGEIP